MLDNAKNSISQLKANLATANSTIAQLQSELAAAKMATLQLVPVSDPAIAKLEANLAAAQFEITAKQQTITKMNNEHSKEVQELTKLLCAKEHTLINWYWNSSPKLAEFVCKKPKSDQCNIQTLLKDFFKKQVDEIEEAKEQAVEDYIAEKQETVV